MGSRRMHSKIGEFAVGLLNLALILTLVAPPSTVRAANSELKERLAEKREIDTAITTIQAKIESDKTQLRRLDSGDNDEDYYKGCDVCTPDGADCRMDDFKRIFAPMDEAAIKARFAARTESSCLMVYHWLAGRGDTDLYG